MGPQRDSCSALWHRLLNNFKFGKVLNSVGNSAFPGIVAREPRLHSERRPSPTISAVFRLVLITFAVRGSFKATHGGVG
jgi:hypothetical protein